MKIYRKEMLVSVLLLAVTWGAFGQVLDNDFVNYDDDKYVTGNLDLSLGFSLDGAIWAFTETRISHHWHPLTWISLALDYELWGMDPFGFHLTNLLLHGANVLLLFLLLRWMTGAVCAVRSWPACSLFTRYTWNRWPG